MSDGREKFTTSIRVSLPHDLARFVRESVDGGRYSSASEVIREAVRLLAAADEGKNSMIDTGRPTRTLGGARYNRRRAIEAMEAIRRIARSKKIGDLSLSDHVHDVGETPKA